MREAVKTASDPSTRVVTGLKAGVNEDSVEPILCFVTLFNDVMTKTWGSPIDFPSRLDLARIDPLNGETGDLSRVFQLKFFFNMCPVSFHRLWAEAQKLCNLVDIVALADPFQNLKFTIAKPVHAIGFILRRLLRNFLDDLRRHCRAGIM